MSQQFYDIISLVILTLGGALLLIALVGDTFKQRIRKNRRCPKCWYDLSHTQGLTCSECGHSAKREAKLYKSRRRWRLVWLAILMFVASHGVSVTPAVIESGWVRAVPTTALIAALSFLEPDIQVVESELDIWLSNQNTALNANWRDSLYLNLLDRCDEEDSLWTWQISLLKVVSDINISDPKYGKWEWENLSEQVIAGTSWRDEQKLDWKIAFSLIGSDNEDCNLKIKTRSVWPIGSRIYADFTIKPDNHYYQLVGNGVTYGLSGFQQYNSSGGCFPIFNPLWNDDHEYIGSIASDQDIVRYSFTIKHWGLSHPIMISRWGAVLKKTIDLPLSVKGNVEDILTPVHSDSFENKLTKNMQPNLEIHKNVTNSIVKSRLDMGINPDKLKEALRLIPSTTFAYKIEILSGNIVVANGEAWHMLTANYGLSARPSLGLVELIIIDEESLINLNNQKQFKLRIVGDPYVALRNFDCDWYWDGEVTVPLTVSIK